MGKLVFFNKDFIAEEDCALNFRDLSIQRGYGVFDFFTVAGYQPVFLDHHIDRFFSSAMHMHLAIQQSKAELKNIVHLLLQKNKNGDCGIRLTLTGGYSPDGYQIIKPNLVISEHFISQPSREQFENGINLLTYPHQRQLPVVKTIDYLMAIWLQPLIKENGADDVLYHHDDVLTECPRANFFMVTADQKIITPVNNILHGITRKKVLELAKTHFAVEERNISLSELRTAREAFITSSTKMILPVAQINGRQLGKSRPVSSMLFNLLSLNRTPAGDQ